MKCVVAEHIPGGLAVTLDDGGLFRETRDNVIAAAVTDEDEELWPRAKFSNGVTTYITQDIQVPVVFASYGLLFSFTFYFVTTF